jgi:hypothetical protein
MKDTYQPADYTEQLGRAKVATSACARRQQHVRHTTYPPPNAYCDYRAIYGAKQGFGTFHQPHRASVRDVLGHGVSHQRAPGL